MPRARAGVVALAPTGETAGKRANESRSKEELPDLMSDSDEEDYSDSESEPDYDSDDPIEEDQFDDKGLRRPVKYEALRTEIPLPKVPLADSMVAEHALCYPALQQGMPQWQVKYLMPWALIFFDLITFDFRVGGRSST